MEKRSGSSQVQARPQPVRSELVKAIPKLPEGFGMLPATQGMVQKIQGLKPGQIVKFRLKSGPEAEARAGSLRKLRRKKKLAFRRVVKRGSEVYVER